MRRAILPLTLVALAGCPEERTEAVAPQVELGATSVKFGTVRVGVPGEGKLTIHSRSRSPLSITTLELQPDPAAPGGAAAFQIAAPVDVVVGDGSQDLLLRFTPPAVGDFRAVLVIGSDDPDPEDALQKVALEGRGGVPKIRVTPECNPPCAGFAVVADPPAIDFGQRPMLRTDDSGRVINEPAWPRVVLANDGEIPLTLVGAGFQGSPGFSSKQSLNAAGAVVAPGEAVPFDLVFDPFDASPAPYEADLVIESDDEAQPTAKVHLKGELAPNKAPLACASIVEVLQPDGSVDVPSAFGAAVAVQPGERGLVKLSAFSDHFVAGLHPNEMAKGDLSLCTTDPEDGRQVLKYRWTVLEKPAESAAVVFADATPEPSFRADAVGHYVLGLEVADPQNKTASATVAFDALPQRDLAVELSWEKQPSVDLDLHLVKPGPCGAKANCLFDRAGDASGYVAGKTGGVFDWGEEGKAYDNPRLDLDDQGDKALIENVSLNRPENDPACATDSCVYDVYVHHFKDWRAGSPTAPLCPGKPCTEGATCGCETTGAGAGTVCVSGRCVSPIRARVKVFIKPTPAHPEAALVVPLDPEVVGIPGPCFTWHAARITWPSKAALAADPNAMVTVSAPGQAGQRSFLYYGKLDPKSFACAPNTPAGTPEIDVTYVSGTVPVYAP